MANTTEKKFGGREKGTPNKSTAEIRALAQLYGEDAIRTLVGLMRQSKDSKIQLAAAKEILDRGHGRPAEMVQPRFPDGPVKINFVYKNPPPNKAILQAGGHLPTKSPVVTETTPH